MGPCPSPSILTVTLGLLGIMVLAVPGAPASAQEVIPKLQAMCPLGYVDTFNGKCSTLGVVSSTVTPTIGDSCPAGWMNIGGGYCRRK